MDIEMEVGMWFEVKEDKDGNIIFEMSYDNNGNGLRFYIKQNNRRYFKSLVKQCWVLLSDDERAKINKEIERKYYN